MVSCNEARAIPRIPLQPETSWPDKKSTGWIQTTLTKENIPTPSLRLYKCPILPVSIDHKRQKHSSFSGSSFNDDQDAVSWSMFGMLSCFSSSGRGCRGPHLWKSFSGCGFVTSACKEKTRTRTLVNRLVQVGHTHWEPSLFPLLVITLFNSPALLFDKDSEVIYSILQVGVVWKFLISLES